MNGRTVCCTDASRPDIAEDSWSRCGVVDPRLHRCLLSFRRSEARRARLMTSSTCKAPVIMPLSYPSIVPASLRPPRHVSCSRIRARRRWARKSESLNVVCDAQDTSGQSPTVSRVAPRSAFQRTARSTPHDRAVLLSSRTRHSRPRGLWSAGAERSPARAATPFVARTAQRSSMRNCRARRAGGRTESDLYQCRRSVSVRPRQGDESAPRSPGRSRVPIRERRPPSREAYCR
jgi:hypothetical protein